MQAIVTSQLFYGLETLSILDSDLRRLDAFQASWLRKALRIPAAFISRISNRAVLDNARMFVPDLQLYSTLHAKRAAVYLGQLCREPASEFTRRAILAQDDSLIYNPIRKIGRPAQVWAHTTAHRLAASLGRLDFDYKSLLDSRWLLDKARARDF